MSDLVRAPEETPLLAAVNKQRARLVGVESGDVSRDDHKALFPQLRAIRRLWGKIIDRRPARDIISIVGKDETSLTEKIRREVTARRNRALYQKVQNGTATPNDLTTSLNLLSFQKNTICCSNQPPSPTEPVKTLLLPQSMKRKHNGDLNAEDLLSDCIICGDEVLFEQVVKAPCSHDYCQSCIQELFKASFKDESLFRPKCCTLDIPLVLARHFLTDEQQDQYTLRDVEVNTKDRTYCSNGTCTTFIIPATIISNVASCTSCQTRTCSLCKNAAHGGLCKKDEAMQQTLELVEKEGWRKCPICTRLVELKQGCNHIS